MRKHSRYSQNAILPQTVTYTAWNHGMGTRHTSEGSSYTDWSAKPQLAQISTGFYLFCLHVLKNSCATLPSEEKQPFHRYIQTETHRVKQLFSNCVVSRSARPGHLLEMQVLTAATQTYLVRNSEGGLGHPRWISASTPGLPMSARVWDNDSLHRMSLMWSENKKILDIL